jgi:hypothetical protein
MAKKAKRKLSKAHLAKMQAGRKKWLKAHKAGKKTGKKTAKKAGKGKHQTILGSIRGVTVIAETKK